MRITIPLLSLLACAHSAPRPAEPEPPPSLFCLSEPPPAQLPFAPTAAGCPPSLVCFDGANGSALAHDLDVTRLYANRAWARCGPRHPTKP